MTEIIQEKDYLRTSDICLVATLCCCGYQIEEVDKSQPSKATFLIRRDKYIDEALRLYFTHQLKVEPLSLFNFLKEIKTRIYHA